MQPLSGEKNEDADTLSRWDGAEFLPPALQPLIASKSHFQALKPFKGSVCEEFFGFV